MLLAIRHKRTHPALTPAIRPVLGLPTQEGWKTELVTIELTHFKRFRHLCTGRSCAVFQQLRDTWRERVILFISDS